LNSQDMKEFLPLRVWVSFLLGVLGSGIFLAAVYVYGNGPAFAQMEDFIGVDRMLFAVALLSTSTLSLMYYYFRRDLSTALAPVVGVLFSLFSGFEDVAVYFFCTLRDAGRCADVSGLPGNWPWLMDTTVGETVTKLSFTAVTDYTIFISIIAWLILSAVLLKTLHGVNTRLPYTDVEV